MDTYLYFIHTNGAEVSMAVLGNGTPEQQYRIPTIADIEYITGDDTDYLSALYQKNGVGFDVNNCTNKHLVLDANQCLAPGQLELVNVRTLLTLWHQSDTYAMFKAMQVLRWDTENKFCSRCGHATKMLMPKASKPSNNLSKNSNENVEKHQPIELAKVCPACSYRLYPRVQPCVIVAITKTLACGKKQILLAKNRRFTNSMQSVIAGFVEVGETLEQAVQREVFEETGLQVANIRYMGSQPWAFPSNLMVAFSADYADGKIVLDDELLDAQFYDYDDLPKIPDHGSIARAMIDALCGA